MDIRECGGVTNKWNYETFTIRAGKQNVTLYIRDKAVMRKLDPLVAHFPDTYKLIE